MALVVMTCENEFIVTDPYADLDYVSPDDILVYNIRCGEKEEVGNYSVKTYGPDPEEYVQEVIDTFGVDPELFSL